jgi:hypothetical protein
MIKKFITLLFAPASFVFARSKSAGKIFRTSTLAEGLRQLIMTGDENDVEELKNPKKNGIIKIFWARRDQY